MEVILIRHLKTKGNLEKRYIGRTDEPLYIPAAPETKMIEEDIEHVVVSPMMRCRQTAGILFPGKKQIVCENLRECDFGEFEGKNYMELTDDPRYQKWIDSDGTLPFPGGEGQTEFRLRSIEGFENVLDELIRDNCVSAAFVVHGGTIMSILSEYDPDKRDFYHWQPENGEGFRVRFKEEEWKSGKKYFTEIEKL